MEYSSDSSFSNDSAIELSSCSSPDPDVEFRKYFETDEQDNKHENQPHSTLEPDCFYFATVNYHPPSKIQSPSSKISHSEQKYTTAGTQTENSNIEQKNPSSTFRKELSPFRYPNSHYRKSCLKSFECSRSNSSPMILNENKLPKSAFQNISKPLGPPSSSVPEDITSNEDKVQESIQRNRDRRSNYSCNTSENQKYQESDDYLIEEKEKTSNECDKIRSKPSNLSRANKRKRLISNEFNNMTSEVITSSEEVSNSSSESFSSFSDFSVSESNQFSGKSSVSDLERSISTHSNESEDYNYKEMKMGMNHIFRNMLLLWCKQNQLMRSISDGDTETDKTVVVSRASGEFGFRIHGSRPVVVSAIEFGTPAETSGLEVGDIVLTINGVNVLDLCHAEVVKLASSCGRDNIHMEVARTCNLIAPLVTTDPTPVCAGYLYKLGTAHRTVGSITRRWHRRWFTLTKDNCLYHYKSESDPQPLGAVVLRGHTVHAFSTSSRPFAFTLSLTGEVGLQLAAHSAESRARWGHVITQAAEQAAQRDELLELSSRRVQQAPGSIATPDCFGYLYKLGARWHQWRRRYCVLKDACLFLYQDTQATQAIGVIYLHGYRVQSTSIGSKRNAFELLPSELRFKHLYFHSDSENDKKRWLSALEYSIDRWIKLG